MNSKVPGRFKFILKDDYEFNAYIITDVIYLNGKPVLYVVDKVTIFQATRFLADITVKNV